MSKWQPIKTAPKDGREILGWRKDCGVLLIRWDCAASFLTESEYNGMSEDDPWSEGWFVADFVACYRLNDGEEPTLWKPIEPPQDK